MNKGIDISHHNGVLDFHKIKAAQVDFVFMKCTEGAFMKDPFFKSNYKEAKKAGLLVGAYHFFRASISAKGQAENFLSVIKDLDLDLPPVFDWEITDKQSSDTQWKGALTWLDTVEIATKRVPIIYTGPAFFNSIGNPKEFKRYPLWIAHYADKPKVPKPWTDWAIHQFTDQGEIDGLHCKFDFNYCDLTKLTV